MPEIRPPVPPFDADSALKKVRAAESAWNTRDPELVASAYTADAVWRNRDEFLSGREHVAAADNPFGPDAYVPALLQAAIDVELHLSLIHI